MRAKKSCRILSLLLAVLMVVGVLPPVAAAPADSSEQSGRLPDASGIGRTSMPPAPDGAYSFGDIVSQFTTTSQDRAAVWTDGEYIYTARNLPSTLYRYNMDGSNETSIQIVNGTWEGDAIRGLTSDGTYVYLVTAGNGTNKVFVLDPTSWTQVREVPISTNIVPLSGITYDPRDGTFWVVNAISTVRHISLDETEGTVITNFNVSGTTLRDIAFDPYSNPNKPILWLTNNVGTTAASIQGIYEDGSEAKGYGPIDIYAKVNDGLPSARQVKFGGLQVFEKDGHVYMLSCINHATSPATNKILTIYLGEADGGGTPGNTVLDEVDVSLAAPMALAEPQETVSGTGYTGTITWSPDDAAFDYDTVYTATVTLTAAQGYEFDPDLAVTVTGATVDDVTATAGTVTFTAAFPATEGEPSAPAYSFGDIVSQFTTTSQDRAAVWTDGEYIYSAKNSSSTIYRYNMDGSNETSIPIVDRTWGTDAIRGLTSDGTYVYLVTAGSGTNSVFVLDPTKWTQIREVPISENIKPLSGITYDPRDGTFWVVNAISTVRHISLDETEGTVITNFNVSGTTLRDIAFDPYSNPNKPILWLTNNVGTTAASIQGIYEDGSEAKGYGPIDIYAKVNDGLPSARQVKFGGLQVFEKDGHVYMLSCINHATSPATNKILTIYLGEADGGGTPGNTVLDEVDVSLAAPMALAEPQETVSGTGYTGTITWSPDDAAFDYDTVYTATVTLTAAQGYEFDPDLAVTVTGATVDDVTATAETVTFTAAFPATASEPGPGGPARGDIALDFTAPHLEQAAVFSDGAYIYTTHEGYLNRLARFSIDGTRESDVTISGFSASVKGMAFDGERYYLVAGGTTQGPGGIAPIYIVEPETATGWRQVGTIDTGSFACQDITYDPDTDTLLVINASGSVSRVSKLTKTLSVAFGIASASTRGIAYDNHSKPGTPIVWITNQSGSSARTVRAYYLDGTAVSGDSLSPIDMKTVLDETAANTILFGGLDVYVKDGAAYLLAAVTHGIGGISPVTNNRILAFYLCDENPPPVTAKINAADTAITAPVALETPQTAVSGTGYTGTIAWTPSATAFGYDTAYTAAVTLTAAQGYEFAPGLSVTVPGATVSNINITKFTMSFRAAFPKTAKELTGDVILDTLAPTVAAPVAGEAASDGTVTATEYTGTVKWNTNRIRFDYNASYTATVTLTAAQGYRFNSDGVAVTVSGATVNVTSVTASTLVFTAAFPPTAQRTGIAPGTEIYRVELPHVFNGAMWTDGEFMYNSAVYSERNYYIDKRTMDGTYIEHFQIAGLTSSEGVIRDMTYDGTYLYGINSLGNTGGQIHVFNLAEVNPLTKVIPSMGKILGSFGNLTGIAYDPRTDSFWTCTASGSIRQVFKDGSTGALFYCGVQTFGLAYDDSDPVTPVLWIGDRLSADGTAILKEIRLDTGTLTGRQFNLDDYLEPGFKDNRFTLQAYLSGLQVFDYEGTRYLLSMVPRSAESAPNLVLALFLSGNEDIIPPVTPEDTPITTIAPAMEAPIAGKPAQLEIDEGIYNGEIVWSPALKVIAFDYGTIYTAAVTLTAEHGYIFASDAAVTVPGAVISDKTVSGKTMRFKLTYPATDPAPERPEDSGPYANVILDIDQLFGYQDASGAALILDPTCTMYDRYENGEYIDMHEGYYYIPENFLENPLANSVRLRTVSLKVPAGTYDWFIMNPTDLGTFVLQRGKAAELEAGKTYIYKYKNMQFSLTDHDCEVTSARAVPDRVSVSGGTASAIFGGEYMVSSLVGIFLNGELVTDAWATGIYTKKSGLEERARINFPANLTGEDQVYTIKIAPTGFGNWEDTAAATITVGTVPYENPYAEVGLKVGNPYDIGYIGYQLLLDPTRTAAGSTDWHDYTYYIPPDVPDAEPGFVNIVFEDTIYIDIPFGRYDATLFSPHMNFYFNLKKWDFLDFEFQSGYSYEFTVKDYRDYTLVVNGGEETLVPVPVTVPVATKTPQAVIAETSLYTGVIVWTPSHSVFAYDTQYSATITLTAKPGTDFTEMDFFVQGAVTSNKSATANTVSFTATFPKTAPEGGGEDEVRTIVFTPDNGDILTHAGVIQQLGGYTGSFIALFSEDVVTIDNAAFQGSAKLIETVIGPNVTYIGAYAFNGCAALTDVTIGSAVEAIGPYAFSGCAALSSLTLREGLETIGWGAFADCVSLTEVVLPHSVSKIEDCAFAGCVNLGSVEFKGEDEILLGDGIFDFVRQVRVKVGGALYLQLRDKYDGVPNVILEAIEAPVLHYDITAAVHADCAGMGSVTGSGRYADGAIVTVAAVAGNGYRFEGWYLSGTKVSSGAYYQFTASAATAGTYMAKFTVVSTDPPSVSSGSSSGKTYAITASVHEDCAGMGSVAGSGSFAADTVTAIAAVPADGYRFEGWYKGDVKVAATAYYQFTVTADTAGTYIARFLPSLTMKGALVALPIAEGGGTVPYYVNASGVRVPVALSTVIGGMAVFLAPVSGSYALMDNSKHYADVTDGWAAEHILRMAERGAVVEVTAGRFFPDSNMTRAEFVAVMAAVSNVNPDDYAGKTYFTDVPANEWYAPYVAWAYQNGIISGVGEGLFSPYTEITREQMAVIMVAYTKYAKLDLPVREIVKFSDEASIADWAAEAVAVFANAGVLTGTGDNRFSPQVTVTRAQVCTAFSRFIDIILKSAYGE